MVDAVFYLAVDEATARYRNLKHNPAGMEMLADCSPRRTILEGNAKFLDMSETAKRVLDAQKKKYGWTTDALAEFQPEKIFTRKAK